MIVLLKNGRDIISAIILAIKLGFFVNLKVSYKI